MTTENQKVVPQSFRTFTYTAMALDPIHVGTGGTRLGRVDNTIVRDPVTRIPKIPGSSLAGVMRAYVAMAKNKYPQCAGQGTKDSPHCLKPDCPVCTVFGFAAGKDNNSGFAGLAAFSDMHVLLFPVPSQLGPQWITSPMALRQIGICCDIADPHAVYRKTAPGKSLNLGWLFLPIETTGTGDKLELIFDPLKKHLAANSEKENDSLWKQIEESLGIVSDKLFTHIVNNNLEVRTSVAIDPATGTAEDKALFTYEALPRSTILTWDLTCRNPSHFKIGKHEGITAVVSPEAARDVVACGYDYLAHLGIGGMGSRGMGRMRVLETRPQNNGEAQK